MSDCNTHSEEYPEVTVPTAASAGCGTFNNLQVYSSALQNTINQPDFFPLLKWSCTKSLSEPGEILHSAQGYLDLIM